PLRLVGRAKLAPEPLAEVSEYARRPRAERRPVLAADPDHGRIDGDAGVGRAGRTGEHGQLPEPLARAAEGEERGTAGERGVLERDLPREDDVEGIASVAAAEQHGATHKVLDGEMLQDVGSLIRIEIAEEREVPERRGIEAEGGHRPASTALASG